NVINPTINNSCGVVGKIPVCLPNEDILEIIEDFTKQNITISKYDWNARETSWDFEQNELIKLKCQSLKRAFELYSEYWSKMFYELHRNEEEIDRQLIAIYGLK